MRDLKFAVCKERKRFCDKRNSEVVKDGEYEKPKQKEFSCGGNRNTEIAVL